jgi:hypothetical protein
VIKNGKETLIKLLHAEAQKQCDVKSALAQLSENLVVVVVVKSSTLNIRPVIHQIGQVFMLKHIH